MRTIKAILFSIQIHPVLFSAMLSTAGLCSAGIPSEGALTPVAISQILLMRTAIGSQRLGQVESRYYGPRFPLCVLI